MTAYGTALFITAAAGCGPFDSPTTLLVMDVSDPATPALRGSYEVPGTITDVEPAGDLTLVASDTGGLLALDANRWGPPILVSSYQPRGRLMDLQAAFGHAYLAVDGRGLEVVTVSFSTLSLVGELRLIGNVSGVQISDGFAAVQGDSTLAVMDIRRPEVPSRLLQTDLDTPQEIWFEVDGHLAYVGLMDTSVVSGETVRDAVLLVLDTRYPPAQVIGRTQLRLASGSTYAQFTRVGDTVLVASGSDELMLLDIADPQYPRPNGTALVWGGAAEVRAAGERAYIRTGTGELRVYVVEPGGKPRLYGSYAPAGAAWDIHPAGTLVYLSGAAGFEIVDARDPAAPARVGGLPDEVGGEIRVVGSRVFLVDHGQISGAGLSAVVTVIDASDPTQPQRLSQPIYGGAVDIVLGDGILVTANRPRYPFRPLHGWVALYWPPRSFLPLYESGLQGSSEVPAPPVALAVDGGYVFVASGPSGLRVYRFWMPRYLPVVAA
jgi:hypothetical protein